MPALEQGPSDGLVGLPHREHWEASEGPHTFKACKTTSTMISFSPLAFFPSHRFF